MQISTNLLIGVAIGVGLLVMLIVTILIFRRMRSGGETSTSVSSPASVSTPTSTSVSTPPVAVSPSTGPLTGTFIVSSPIPPTGSLMRLTFSVVGTNTMMEIAERRPPSPEWRVGLYGPYTISIRDPSNGMVRGTFTSVTGPMKNKPLPIAYQIVSGGLLFWLGDDSLHFVPA